MEIFWDQHSQSEWAHLADLAQAPMQQRWTYGAVHRALGGHTHRAVLMVNGEPVAICQCLSRMFGAVLTVSLASHGPLFLGACDQARALRLIKRSHPARHPRLYLFTLVNSIKSKRLIPLMTPATNAVVSLPAAYQNLHGKWRNALKSSDKNQMKIVHSACDTRALAALLSQDANSQSAKSYRALPPAFTQSWQQIAPQDLRLFTAQKEGETIASALFLCHGTTATYHIAHSTQQGRKTQAARAVLWRAFQDFTKQGVTKIDLGVIDTENAPGLARFKLGTGAQTVQSGPTVLTL